MRNVALIGSTGSIGRNALQVIEQSEGALCLHSIFAKANDKLLLEQALKYRPAIVGIFQNEKKEFLQNALPFCRVVSGLEGVEEVCSASDVDIVLNAAVGMEGLLPTRFAIESGKCLALANKESLVAGGHFVVELAKRNNCTLLPVDSEHSALFQCLIGEDVSSVRKVILTASGGPFLNFSSKSLHNVTVEQALGHPTWSMGKKICIDSSTLMNKGLEVIEAQMLFSLPINKIDVLVHPQSIVHGMVEFQDGSLKGQFGPRSMCLPIQFALTYPQRIHSSVPSLNFAEFYKWEFYAPDMERFPCLKIAIDAALEGKSYPCFMNAVNEVLVHRFLNRAISWMDIGVKLDQLMQKHLPGQICSFEDIEQVQKEAILQATHC